MSASMIACVRVCEREKDTHTRPVINWRSRLLMCGYDRISKEAVAVDISLLGGREVTVKVTVTSALDLSFFF